MDNKEKEKYYYIVNGGNEFNIHSIKSLSIEEVREKLQRKYEEYSSYEFDRTLDDAMYALTFFGSVTIKFTTDEDYTDCIIYIQVIL